ncbi:39S ribosomal protein L22, mitochondrial-like [Dreissena polymorpha]|uniref:Large ribosomal subunit protein uL22m n=1 Tax=Dreissena polymorpha TaxID=45954 RepID=A0A9D4KPB2_DREPO|nr:39S ribosomal protein L22, mitochondrial-like [Dreissena polymorpha]KAH3842681.1 hypothetical protein DPMN_116185 [Dreissena polymorpha]
MAICMRTIQQLSGVAKRFPNVTWSCLSKSYLHTSAQLQDSTTSDRVSPEMKRTSNDEKIARKKTYLKYNLIKYEPSKEGEELRPAEVVHQKEFILISPKKMWYPAVMIRGMSIDEAINQCEFSGKSAAKVIRDVLKEAQRLAVSSY